MELTCCLVLVLLLINQSVGSPGDPVMYLPPLELRTVDMNNRVMPLLNSQFTRSQLTNSPLVNSQLADQFANTQFVNSQFPPSNEGLRPSQVPQQPLPQHQIIHTTPTPTPPPPSSPEMDSETERPRDHHNFTLNEFVNVLNEIAERNDESHDSESRAAARDYDSPPPAPYPPYSSYPPYGGYSRPYGPPQRPSYGPYGSYGPTGYGSYGAPPPAYHAPKPAYAPAPVEHDHIPKTVNPALTGLLKPVTSKVASKVSGLIGLVLTLLTGSAPNGLVLTGFKDIVINGIFKPLLIAKGGIKSLISKLSIPVISLLLINVEVLLTVWWLWEECPQPTSYSYSKPSYSYNNSY